MMTDKEKNFLQNLYVYLNRKIGKKNWFYSCDGNLYLPNSILDDWFNDTPIEEISIEFKPKKIN